MTENHESPAPRPQGPPPLPSAPAPVPPPLTPSTPAPSGAQGEWSARPEQQPSRPEHSSQPQQSAPVPGAWGGPPPPQGQTAPTPAWSNAQPPYPAQQQAHSGQLGQPPHQGQPAYPVQWGQQSHPGQPGGQTAPMPAWSNAQPPDPGQQQPGQPVVVRPALLWTSIAATALSALLVLVLGFTLVQRIGMYNSIQEGHASQIAELEQTHASQEAKKAEYQADLTAREAKFDLDKLHGDVEKAAAEVDKAGKALDAATTTRSGGKYVGEEVAAKYWLAISSCLNAVQNYRWARQHFGDRETTSLPLTIPADVYESACFSEASGGLTS